MPTVTPFLWFDNQTEEAMNFYTSLFKDSKVHSVSRYPDGMPGMGGQVMSATFELNGQIIMALNGGPQYKFTEAVSLFVSCETQAEVDELWEKLTANGGEEGPCGWLKDKFGLSWQIVPTALGQMLGDPDQEKSNRALQAMLKMKKIDVAVLRQAFEG
ncbi:MAG: VOC family protein [Anaerolineae bacterium]